MTVDNHIYDSLPDPVILLDEKRTIVFANRAAQELLDCRVVGGDLALSLRHPAVIDAIDRLRERVASHIAEISFPKPVERSFELHAIRIGPQGKEVLKVADVLF